MMGERDSSGEGHPCSQWSDELKALPLFFCLFSFRLQQQGIFRVPGSQVEVNDIKNSFERGKYGDHLQLVSRGSQVGSTWMHLLEPVLLGQLLSTSPFQLHLQGLYLGTLKSPKAGVYTTETGQQLKTFNFSFSPLWTITRRLSISLHGWLSLVNSVKVVAGERGVWNYYANL